MRTNRKSAGAEKTIILLTIFMCGVAVLWGMLNPDRASSGPYFDSAHGSTTYGVKRTATGFPADYTRGLCGHCHEQHASIGGAEPQPQSGGTGYFALLGSLTLQSTRPYWQWWNPCFFCHYKNLSPYYQDPFFPNYSYSITFGGYNSTTPDNIYDAFNSYTSYHNLKDIRDLAISKWPATFTDKHNPCNACHNPHIAKRSCGKPSGSYDPTTSSISRPSNHNSLWGDDAGERMNAYTGSYQAPYRYNSFVTYEPDGSATQNGSNLTDYVTFCTDCHNASNTIWSTTKSRNLSTFDWNLEKHGKGIATNDGFTDVKAPYQVALLGNYVLSCTDCHEPHGSSNVFLIRNWINNTAISPPGNVPVTVTSTAETGVDGSLAWKTLCIRCHMSDGTTTTHAAHVLKFACSECHYPNASDKRVCIECHYHGSTFVTLKTTGKTLYNSGEHLF